MILFREVLQIKSLYIKKVTFRSVKHFWFQTEQPRDLCHAPQQHVSDSSDPCNAAHSKMCLALPSGSRVGEELL